jgi:probable rRNA maturation factor
LIENPSNLDIDIAVTGTVWQMAGFDFSQAARDAVRAAFAAHPVPGPTEVSILLCDDAAIRALNRTHRGLDQPTDTLSFAAGPTNARPMATGAQNSAAAVTPLGDIVIAFETAAKDAELQGKTMSAHLAHLVVHSYLHLLGFDHEQEAEAKVMEDEERRILEPLGIADPYTLR